MSQNTEFSVQLAHRYDQRSTLRWLVSHVWRYKLFAFLTMACYILAWLVFAGAPVMIGRAAEEIIHPTSENGLLWISLTILGFLLADGLFMLTGSLSASMLQPSSPPMRARSCTPACSAKARHSMIASASAILWPAPLMM